MKKLNKLFILPIFLILLTGCINLNLKKYDPSENNPSISNPNNKIDDFYSDSATTYTDNTINTSLKELYSTCKKATVTIEIYVTRLNQAGEETLTLYSSGSGFIAKESESYLYIYTNAHVTQVSTSSQIKKVHTEVILANYDRYSATVIFSDGDEDVAILRIDKPNDTSSYLVASIANSNELSPGEPVFAIGSPLGLNFTSSITTGIISKTNVSRSTDNNEDGDETTMYLLQTDTTLNPGNSGGPLFNYNGQVIGVNTLKLIQSQNGTNLEGISFSIPINHFNIVAESLINTGSYTRPRIGVSLISIVSLPLEARKNYNITIQKGLYIDEVTNTNSGLIENTIITHINNKEVTTFSDIAIELYNYTKGQSISITYCNPSGTNSKTISITLI